MSATETAVQVTTSKTRKYSGRAPAQIQKDSAEVTSLQQEKPLAILTVKWMDKDGRLEVEVVNAGAIKLGILERNMFMVYQGIAEAKKKEARDGKRG